MNTNLMIYPILLALVLLVPASALASTEGDLGCAIVNENENDQTSSSSEDDTDTETDDMTFEEKISKFLEDERKMNEEISRESNQKIVEIPHEVEEEEESSEEESSEEEPEPVID